jgi:hypothetical protein
MCEPQTRGKYLNRNSPAFPANKCCGQVKIGQDGQEYVSRRTSAGICRWVPTSWNTSDKIVIVKRSTKKLNPELSKLVTRNSPPYEARYFKGMTKKGNDGKMYVSVEGKLGRFRWVRKVKK